MVSNIQFNELQSFLVILFCFVSPIHSIFWKAMCTMSAFQHCQSETQIAMVTFTNKEVTTRFGVGATLSLSMAFYIITRTCLILWHWAWPSFLTIQLTQGNKVGKSFTSVLFLLTNHQGLTTLLQKVPWIEQGNTQNITHFSVWGYCEICAMNGKNTFTSQGWNVSICVWF